MTTEQGDDNKSRNTMTEQEDKAAVKQEMEGRMTDS